MAGKGIDAAKELDIYHNPLAVDVLLFLHTVDRNSADVYDLEKHILGLKKKGKKIKYGSVGDNTQPKGIRGILGHYEGISDDEIPKKICELLGYFDNEKIIYKGGLREITLTAVTGLEIACEVVRNTQKFERFGS